MDTIQYLSKKRYNNWLVYAYFTIASFEVLAESFKDIQFIWFTKPLIIPILILFYWSVSNKPNFIFIVALFFNWIANIFFISQDYNHTIIGAILFLVYRILVIYLTIKIVKFPGFMPIIISALPFLMVYLYFINLTYENLGNGIYIFILHGVFIVFFVALAIGNYFFKPNRASMLLLISAIFFTATQFILVLKYCYLSLNIFQPLAMILFVIGQYLLVKFLLLSEKKSVRYEIINKLAQNET